MILGPHTSQLSPRGTVVKKEPAPLCLVKITYPCMYMFLWIHVTCVCSCVQVYVMWRPEYNLGCYSLVTGHFVVFCFVGFFIFLFFWFLSFWFALFYFCFVRQDISLAWSLPSSLGWPVTPVSASAARSLLMHRSSHRASNAWANTHDFECSEHHMASNALPPHMACNAVGSGELNPGF